jgi:hypothetical protein
MNSRALALTTLCATVLLMPAGARTQTQAAPTFTAPVQVSPDAASTWEPTMLIDRFGNIFITARKDTSPTQLVLSPDDRSPTATRSMSWLWASSDGGQTFDNVHGLPLDIENHNWGYEADIALDDAGHLYMADQNYADSTLTRWTVSGLGDFAFDYHRPLIPSGQPVDDRPWLAAHGDGTVVYMAQAGAPQLNPLGREGGEAYGPGRYSIYHSTDSGTSFDLIGRALAQSGGCRPAADHRPGSKLFYVACTNDGGAQGLFEIPQGRGTLWAYVSEDDGASYSRYRIGGYNAYAETYDWPVTAVGPDGDAWVLHVDAGIVDYSQSPVKVVTNRLMLYHSTDQGRTWSQQDITPAEGRYRWGWIDVSSDGRLAIGIQHRPDDSSPWRFYASIFHPGSIPELVALDVVDEASSPEPPSELVGIAFAPDGTLGVAWTRVEPVGPLGGFRVYFSRSLPDGS